MSYQPERAFSFFVPRKHLCNEIVDPDLAMVLLADFLRQPCDVRVSDSLAPTVQILCCAPYFLHGLHRTSDKAKAFEGVRGRIAVGHGASYHDAGRICKFPKPEHPIIFVTSRNRSAAKIKPTTGN